MGCDVAPALCKARKEACRGVPEACRPEAIGNDIEHQLAHPHLHRTFLHASIPGDAVPAPSRLCSDAGQPIVHHTTILHGMSTCRWICHVACFTLCSHCPAPLLMSRQGLNAGLDSSDGNVHAAVCYPPSQSSPSHRLQHMIAVLALSSKVSLSKALRPMKAAWQAGFHQLG